MSRLGIVVSHPIQYYAPLFRHLAKHIDLEVFYGLQPTAEQVGRSGFGIAVDWGIDLLDGYKFQFIQNVSSKPSTDNFFGIDTPSIGDVLSRFKITHTLILGWQLKSYWQTYLYCLKNAIPVAVRGDSQLNPYESKCKTLTRRTVYPLFLKRYQKILYVGQRNKQYLLQNGARPEQLLFSPHAVDQTFWRPIDTRRPTNQTIRFLWVAKFIGKKRPEDAISGFLKALQKRPDIELHMVGAGDLLDQCISHVGSESRVKFLGFRNQVALRDIYANSDCLLLTSDAGETWGLVVNEAMSMGLPSIVSDACGCSADLIKEGETGYQYKYADIDDLSNRIIQISDILRSNRNAFQEHISQRNTIYSFDTTITAAKDFIGA